MIGTDFRAPTAGMAEILDRGLESERQFMQALSRVERYGERAVRMITSRTAQVDEALHKALVQRLINFQVKPILNPPVATQQAPPTKKTEKPKAGGSYQAPFASQTAAAR